MGMDRKRISRLAMATILALLLSAWLVTGVQAQTPPATGLATLLGWSSDGNALFLSTPSTLIQLGLDGSQRDLRPSEEPMVAAQLAKEPDVPPDVMGRLTKALGGPGWLLGRPRRSPDGRWLAVVRVPTGTETLAYAELWLADAQGHPLRLLDNQGAYAPRWSPDGRTLAYLRAGTVWLLDLPHRSTRALTSMPASPSVRPPARSPARASAPVRVPKTIRVIHHPDNPCRNRPAWAVDVIPFEEYLRHVVPAEVPALWPQAVVRAQAIAARTYAWYQVLQGRPDFDVTDWIDYQVMCDATHPASDAAVAATRGQYLAYQGQPILAQYGADNGHPTQDGGLPYLRAVPDPVSLGYPRRGHGHGMSQWGAYRWVTRYGWDDLQLLTHYYSNIEVRHAGEAPPIRLGVTGPWPGLYHNGQGVWLEANAAPSKSIARVTFWADGQIVGVDEDAADGWGTALALDTIGEHATITVSAQTISGTVLGENALWLGVDREPPTGAAILLPPTTPPPTITLGLTGDDTGPAGFLGLGISAAWSWEGEDFQGAPGSPITDTEAYNGRAWEASANASQPGVWISPPAQTLPVGRVYRALFRLRTSAPLTSAVVARLEVTADNGTRLLGLAEVRGLHFRSAGAYQDIPVDFWYDAPSADGVRFLVRYTATADLALDRVLVVEYPTLQPPEATWPLPNGVRVRELTVVAFDAAGNASPPQPIELSFGEMPGPGSWQDAGPTQCITDTSRPSAYITVWARGGLEPAGAACRVSGDEGATWSEWFPAIADASAGAITPTRLRCQPTYPRQGEGLWVQFRAEDVHGRTAVSPAFPVRVDTQPPLISLETNSEQGTEGWFLGPVTVTVTDTVSGLSAVSWRTADGSREGDAFPLVVDWPGTTVIQVQALDRAGLQSRETITIAVDMASPTASIYASDEAQLPLFPIRWRGTDDASGIAGYDVQVLPEHATTWQDWLVSTTSQKKLFLGHPQTRYRFRVRAHDLAGRTGPWSPTVSVTVTAQPVFLPSILR